MEYGLRIATLESAFKNPGDFVDSEFTDFESSELYPDAPVTALYFGSEFCQDLLPGKRDAEAFCALCAERKLEAVLLTPIVTHRGLTRINGLLESLVRKGRSPSVVFNDWGVLELLRTSYASLPLRMGRLMNRGLRDPRLAMRAAAPAGENTERGSGIRKLAAALGVTALESDADLEPGYLGDGANGLQRTLHLPFTFVTSGRNCLEKAAATPKSNEIFTRGLKSGCKAPCRGRCRREFRADTQKQMWRAGNTLFYQAPPQWVSRHMALADRVVLHERPMS